MDQQTLYVSDLDGTLLNRQHQLSSETIVILKALVEEGLDFVVATARNYASAKQLLEPLNYKNPLILANGALIVDESGNTLWASVLDRALAVLIDTHLEAWRGHAVWSSLTGGNHLELPQNPSHQVLKFEAHRRDQGFVNFSHTDDPTSLFMQELFTVTYMVDLSQANAIEKRLQEAGIASALAVHIMPYPGLEGVYTLTIQAGGTNKGAALKHLLKLRGIDASAQRIVAFGDHLNDCELLQAADEGYAVLEAHEKLKSLATGIIGSHDDSAVARWLAKDHQKKVRIDERDIMFARMRYESGSDAHKDYYKRNPDKLEGDEQLKKMPHIFGPQTATFHPQLSPFGDAGFEVIGALKQAAEQLAGPLCEPMQIDDVAMAKQICDFARQLGCDDVALVCVDAEDLYSHKGREHYGRTIDHELKNGIVLVKAMDTVAINRAPQLEACFTVVKAYLDLATIGLWLAKYIEKLGYRATAHIDGHYEAFLPALAEKSGLGEIGRANLLIHPKFGMSLRLAMVTTDLPLWMPEEVPNRKSLKAFCTFCKRCATTCPGKAIDSGDMAYNANVRVATWPFVQESCYAVWRRLGTDCGVCLSSCPWTQGLTDSERALMETEGPEAAFLAYNLRQPLRQYTREPLPWLNYPVPPRGE